MWRRPRIYSPLHVNSPEHARPGKYISPPLFVDVIVDVDVAVDDVAVVVTEPAANAIGGRVVT